MLTSSPSPTISAPSSPHASFRHSFYHASYRNPSSTSPNSSHNSPRYTPARRLTQTQTNQPPPTEATISKSPPRKDTGTQYSPLGYPPTYRSSATRPPRAQRIPSVVDKSATAATLRNPGTTKRRESSAETIGTTAEQAGAKPRVEPQTPQTQDKGKDREKTTNAATSNAPSNTTAPPQAEDAPEESPSKRARPEEPRMKTMPRNYEDCDMKDLGILVSEMLMELCDINDKIPLKDGQLTRFHSRAPPGISVRDYLNRIIVHATISPPILLSMVYYVDRLCALYPAFTISSLTVHRFLIVAATVGSKGLSDSFWTNSVYARVGGVSAKELSLLEMEFLRRIEWRIVPKPEVLVDYYRGLVERTKGYAMAKRTEQVAGDDTKTVLASDSSDDTSD